MARFLRLVIGLLIVMGAPAVVRGQATDTVVHFHTDAVGSVRMVTDANGQMLERHDYAPFGEPVQVGTQTSRFAGSERDAESELGYFGARHYRPLTGRFTTVDPLLDPARALVQPRRWNRYAYSLNNSLAFVDPDGRDPATVATRLVQSPPVQRLINHPITQRLLASSGISSGTAALQRLNNRLFDISVKLFSTPGGHASVETAAQLLTGADLGPTGVAGAGIGAVIGHYDAGYNIVGRKLGVAVFDLGRIFDQLSVDQQIRANRAFLDAVIERGHNILVVAPGGVRSGSFLQAEIDYLLSKGYKWNDGNDILIAPNPR